VHQQAERTQKWTQKLTRSFVGFPSVLWHCQLGNTNGHSYCEKPCQLPAKVLLWNVCAGRRMGEGEVTNLLGRPPLKLLLCMTSCLKQIWPVLTAPGPVHGVVFHSFHGQLAASCQILATPHSSTVPFSFHACVTLHLQCFDTVGWALRRTSGMQKLSDKVLAWLSVWSKVQMICIWSSWCYCHPIVSCFIKIQTGLNFLVLPYSRCPGKQVVKRVSVCLSAMIHKTALMWHCGCCYCYVLVQGQVTIIFVVSVGLSVCLCRVFLSRLWSDFDQTRTHVTCLGLVVSLRYRGCTTPGGWVTLKKLVFWGVLGLTDCTPGREAHSVAASSCL